MKTILLLLVLTSLRGLSQNIPADLYINIKNSLAIPVPLLEVKLHEQGSNQYFYALTNKSGGAKFKVVRGRKYVVDVFRNEGILEVSVPEKGVQPVIQNISYDFPDDLTGFDTTYVKDSKFRMPAESEAVLKVLVYGDKFKAITNQAVRLVCPMINKVYVGKTGDNGYAQFIVYPGCHYEIGVGEFDNLNSVDVPEKGGVMSEARVLYQPTNIKENDINDTITQQILKDQRPTTTHVLVQIRLWDMSNKPLADEFLYLDKTGTTKVYAAKTDEKGFAYFLLSKGAEFTINLKYERDIDKIKQPHGPEFHRVDIEFNTMGAKNIEAFYKNSKRDQQGFLTEFMSPKITPCTFDPAWLEKTKNGFHVNFPSQSSTSPPAVNGNKLLINSGFYSPEFYSIDRKTGKADWGARLAENGISSSVVVDDIILMNTESCTLYAIDAKTGSLLWSKWLGPSIYSTPAVAEGRVLAVYPRELRRQYNFFSNALNDKHYVLVAFDLKSGNIVWQNWVDYDVLASPVVAGDKVYMTSMAGTLYQFDLNNGKILFEKHDNAVSPPTIVDDNVFVSVQDAKNGKVQETVVYSAKNMKVISKISQVSGKNLFARGHLSAIDRMNYSAGRVAHYKGKNYNVLSGKLFCFDQTGKIFWQIPLASKTHIDSLPKSSMPVIAGNKIMICNGKKIQLYDPAQGKLLKEFPVTTELYSDAIAFNGWIYAGSKNGKIISIDTKDPTITGWNTWCGNPGHNPVVK